MFSQVLSSWRGQQVSQNKRLTQNTTQWLNIYCLLSSSSLCTRFFSSLFSSQTIDLYCVFNSFTTQPQHWSLSTNLDQQKIWNPRTFAADLHERRARKKKMELKAWNVACDLDLLVGGCARDRWLQVWNSILFTYFLVFGTTKLLLELNGRKLRIFGFRLISVFVWKFYFLLRWVRIFCVICRLYEWKFGFFF